MHFQRMLLDIIVCGYIMELARIPQFLYNRFVDSQITEGGRISRKLGQGTVAQIESMRGSEEKDALRLAEVKAFVSPGGARPRVRIARVSVRMRSQSTRGLCVLRPRHSGKKMHVRGDYHPSPGYGETRIVDRGRHIIEEVI
jgi:hypothetical protein